MFIAHTGSVLRVSIAGAILAGSLAGLCGEVLIAASATRPLFLSFSERQRETRIGFCNEDTWLALADLRREAGGDTLADLQHAVECNPDDSHARILLALENEGQGNKSLARELFYEATQVDHGFVPAWSLANFYLRRGETDLFFTWMRKALSVAFFDIRTAFYLCWKVSNDKERILSVIPHKEQLLLMYVNWLDATHRTLAAYDASTLLSLSSEQRTSPNILLSLCNSLIEEGDGWQAVAIWNRLSKKGLIAGGEVHPESGHAIVNGGFSSYPIDNGLDWRFGSSNGISVSPSPPGIRVSLDGNQPETCELLSQYVVLEPGKSYVLAYKYETSFLGNSTSLQWHLRDAATNRELLTGLPPIKNNTLEEQQFTFTFSSHAPLARIMLVSQREYGEMRAEGSIKLMSVSLKFATSSTLG